MVTVSTTELSGFGDCERKSGYASLNFRGIEPAMPSMKMFRGTLVHATLADWSLEWSRGNHDLGVALDAWEGHWKRAETYIKNRYLRKTGVEMSVSELDEGYGEPIRDLGAKMIAGYVRHYLAPYPHESYELLAVEQPVTVPIPGTEHCACYDAGECSCGTRRTKYVTTRRCALRDRYRCYCARYACVCRQPDWLECTYDQVLQDHKGRICVPDHKTFDRHPTSFEIQRSDQFRGYTWAATQVWTRQEVVGVLYNGLWARDPEKPPKGRTSDDCFYRTMALYNDEEIAEHGHFLPRRVARFVEAMRRPLDLEPRRTWATCPGCGFQDLCDAQTRGEDLEWLLEDYVPREKSPAWRTLLEANGD